MSSFWAAAEKFLASKVNRQIDLQKPTRYTSSLSSNMSSLTAYAWTAAPGTLQTIVTETNGTELDISATWEYEPGSTMFGRIYVDGVDTTYQSVITVKGIVSLIVPWTLGAAGSHTVEMYVLVTGTSGTVFTGGTHMLTRAYEIV